MTVVVDGTLALRNANHLLQRLAAQGVWEEDLERLRDIRDWIRGMGALDIMRAQGPPAPE